MDIQLIVERALSASIWTAGNHKPGDVIWVRTEAAARHLIEAGFCRLPKSGEVFPGPKVTPYLRPPGAAIGVVGPTETKPAGPTEAPSVGPSEFKGDSPPLGKLLRPSDSAPLDRFAVVTRAWEEKTVVIIAGGPSLTEADLERIRVARETRDDVRVIAVNDAYLVAPYADLNYFADARWWKWHADGLEKNWPWARFSADEVRGRFARFAGQKCSIGISEIRDERVFLLKNGGSDGLSRTPNEIRTGCNSGYQAINIAFLSGARKIVLVAFDMQFANGKSHSHNGHPIRMPESVYAQYVRIYETTTKPLADAGVDIVNCSPISAIRAYRRSSLEKELI